MPAFAAVTATDLASLEAAIEAGSVDLEIAALNVDLARAASRQSRIRPNPALDLGWGTIPLGRTNPSDLERPLRDVPNYGAGLSYTVPIGKRRPAIAQAEALQRAAEADLADIRRHRVFDLGQLLGALAAATLRREGMSGLVDEGERSLGLAEAELQASFGLAIEVDRLRVDVLRTATLLTAIEGEIEGLLAECSAMLGRSCVGFTSEETARTFLERWASTSVVGGEVELDERPDLRALREAGSAAEAEWRYARAMAYPDPTIRLGYFYDRFAASGAQVHSLNLGVSIPIPVSERGQAAREAAESRSRRLGSIAARQRASAQARIDGLQRRLATEQARRREISSNILPAAERVLDDLEKAAAERLVPLTEVVHARRVAREVLIQEAEAYQAAHIVVFELLRELPPTAAESR